MGLVEERNNFEKLIDEYGAETKDSDLLKLLDMASGLRVQAFVLSIPLAIQATMIFAGFNLAPTSLIWVNTLLFLIYAGALICFGYQMYKIFTSDPLDRQISLLYEYINARRRLRELRDNAGD